MKKLFLFAFITAYGSLNAQLYQQDIFEINLLSQKIKSLSLAGIVNGTATGYDAYNTKSRDFNEWQSLHNKENYYKVVTRNGQDITTQIISFDKNFLITKIIDSSAGYATTTIYTYNEQQKLVQVKVYGSGNTNDVNEDEIHIWEYNSNGEPTSIKKINNATDTASYTVLVDEAGNVIEEQLVRRSTIVDRIYYYYNKNNLLTDIVRYNKKVKKLLPDVIYEYDAAGNMIQKMALLTVLPPNYIIFRYAFNDKGIKVKEALFNKQKELTGKIEYAYTTE